jgi:curli biogenesis system outer membrane secretion channel CsgG
MKVLRLLLLLALLTSLSSCASSERYVKNPERLEKVERIAVLPFRSNRSDIGRTIAESMSASLIRSRYRIIERSQLEKILEEQEMTVEGIVKGDRSFVGQISGVDALILGSATVDRGFAGLAHGGNIDYVSNATARMIDVETGKVLVAATFTSEGASTMSGVTTATEVGEQLAGRIIGD